MADEYLLMGLRLAEGIEPERFTQLSGRKLDPQRDFNSCAKTARSKPPPDGRLRVTQSGFPLLDAVVADLAA